MADRRKPIANEAEKEREIGLADLRTVMGTAAGRRVVWRWLAHARVFAPCFTGSSETFYREGRREFGLRMFHEVLEACPDLYSQAVRELKARESATGDG